MDTDYIIGVVCIWRSDRENIASTKRGKGYICTSKYGNKYYPVLTLIYFLNCTVTIFFLSVLKVELYAVFFLQNSSPIVNLIVSILTLLKCILNIVMLTMILVCMYNAVVCVLVN